MLCRNKNVYCTAYDLDDGTQFCKKKQVSVGIGTRNLPPLWKALTPPRQLDATLSHKKWNLRLELGDVELKHVTARKMASVDKNITYLLSYGI